jgi:hypothetical protein
MKLLVVGIAATAAVAGAVTATVASAQRLPYQPIGDFGMQRLLEEATPVVAAEGSSYADEATARHLTSQGSSSSSSNLEYLSNYSIQYVGCAGIVTVNEYRGMLQRNGAVRFALCPTGNSRASARRSGRCPGGGGGGGEYVVSMTTFLRAYTGHLLTKQERQCAKLYQSSGCLYTNDETRCEQSWYSEQGHNECIAYEGQDAFQVRRYLECTGA